MTFNKKESDMLLRVKNDLEKMWDGKLHYKGWCITNDDKRF